MAVSGKGDKYTPGGDHKKKRPRKKGGRPRASVPKAPQVLDDPAYFTNPMTLRTALTEAGRAADLRYEPVQHQIATQQRQVPAWFDQYRASLQTPQQVQATYQPMIAQQQAAQAQTAQATPGLDPSSPQGQQDAQAAKAREALANLGTSVLLANQGADTTYFQGRAPVANAAQIGLQNQLSSQAQQTAREKGLYLDQAVAETRDRERAYGLQSQHQAVENKAFDLDVSEAAGINPLTGKPLPPKDKKDVITTGPFAGYTKGQIRGMSPAKKDQLRKAAKGKSKPGEPQYGIDADVWEKMSPAERKRAKDRWEAGGDGPGNGKDKFGNTVRQQRTANSAWKRAKNTAGTIVKPDDSWRDVYSLLLVKYPNIDADILRAASMRATKTPLGPKIKQSLKAQGVKLGKQKKPAQRPAHAPAGANGEYRPT